MKTTASDIDYCLGSATHSLRPKWMPAAVRAEIARQTEAAFNRLDLAGITPVAVREGTVGPQARSLGAAAIPLAQRYLLDQTAILKDV